ncbi:hypothetical protein HDIA_2623 [Hartmannibacter diazotrophicus]|uniref:Anti-sigma factor NepR domain-containing protein n=1 Tax=Hartmannibacter diazotrophicus TaxID=1482074 RepID=A0A2C9D765_9HYPH|nr:NepR family anti-sigma factor [Hartmannibacter diazotrophicus]SON56164.1 hypothetical protein HDIA_2623 [Hartmannibacter diazotrophicus]
MTDTSQAAGQVAGSEARPKDAPGSAETNGAISRKLRELYQTVQDEGVPDRFLDLLDKLDAAERLADRERQK